MNREVFSMEIKADERVKKAFMGLFESLSEKMENFTSDLLKFSVKVVPYKPMEDKKFIVEIAFGFDCVERDSYCDLNALEISLTDILEESFDGNRLSSADFWGFEENEEGKTVVHLNLYVNSSFVFDGIYSAKGGLLKSIGLIEEELREYGLV